MEEYQDRSLRGRVFRHLREDILNGVYKNHEELREVTIGEELGVSRTPVREALRQLELEGLVTIIPNKGAYVTAITRKDVKDIYKIRSQLEAPELQMDGEMHGDAALSEDIRQMFEPDSTLSGEANILVMPNIDAANISYSLLKMIGGDGITIGPILMGMNQPVHIITPISTVRRIVNMVALAAVDAQRQ